ncbi:hypothetical protein [Subtercola boreus]|uniref:hypothetical protein n=1 Tax=Subtercola boreus TaxID=120213 RepID=UPI0011C0457E|nr:hypothetical protein [Subtercola boreus]
MQGTLAGFTVSYATAAVWLRYGYRPLIHVWKSRVGRQNAVTTLVAIVVASSATAGDAEGCSAACGTVGVGIADAVTGTSDAGVWELVTLVTSLVAVSETGPFDGAHPARRDAIDIATPPAIATRVPLIAGLFSLISLDPAKLYLTNVIIYITNVLSA